MAKRRIAWSEATYRKYLAESRGQGILSEYKPWITIQDFPSKGIVSRVQGITTGRVHHFMSNLELHYFYILDWSEKTLDIREQFPLLDLQETIEIADKMGVKYPFDNLSGFPYVLTSDFLITTTHGIVARSVKPSKELRKKRVLEKMEIERQYWGKRNIGWKIVTEREISPVKARNIEWLLSGESALKLIPDAEIMTQSVSDFMLLYESQRFSWAEIIESIERKYGFHMGVGIAIFKMLVRERRIYLDISREINLETSERKLNV